MQDKLIVALDVDDLAKAKKLVDELYPTVKLFKIGNQLFTAYGPEAIKMVGEKGARVFLDLKFYDIPNTVFSGVASGTSVSCERGAIKTEVKEDDYPETTCWPVFMMTVHIDPQANNKEMLVKAVEAARKKAEELKREKRPYIVGVTVLTSNDYGADTSKIVLERAKFAQEAGLDGVVCSAHEAATVREKCGKDFIIVAPGIRPEGFRLGDQARVATPRQAIAAGADFIVVGRPIIETENALKAAQEIIREIS